MRGALESGLEMDVSRIATATSVPVIEGGTLDFNNSPTYGTVELTALFSPDPYTIEVVSGGAVDASYLGGGCVGHAAEPPDVRLSGSGVSPLLRVSFNAAVRMMRATRSMAPRSVQRVRRARPGSNGRRSLRRIGI